MKLSRNFWRIVTLALALVMMFSVVACGNDAEPDATTEEASADGTTTAAPATTQKPATTEKPTTSTTAPTTEPTTEKPTDPVDPPVDDLTKPDVWDGAVDMSWFDQNNPQTEYTFTTAAQFAGFMKIRQNLKGTYYFEGVTIKLARDLILNDLSIDEMKTSGGKQTEALHSSQALFKGTFDGQGHTIKGVYVDCTSSGYKALFGGIGDNAVIKNLKIDTAYFNASEKDKVAGGFLVARALGQDMLISNVTVTNAWMEESDSQFSAVGLLVAKLDTGSSLTIENCSTDGTINFPTKGTNKEGFGGIIGRIESGKAETLDDNANYVPEQTTSLVLKACSSTATINANEYCGGLVGTMGDFASLKMDVKCKFTGTLNVGEVTVNVTDPVTGEVVVDPVTGEPTTTTVPGASGTYVGWSDEVKPEQPIIVPELTVDDFSKYKYPEFDAAGTIVIEASSAEAGSVSMTVTDGSKYNLFNKDNNAGAAAHGIYKLAQGTNPDGTPLYHYYIDFGNVNKKIEAIYGADYKIASVDDCYIRWTFTVTEAGTYTVGSYMRLKNNADRVCMVQFDDQTPIIMHYTLSADDVAAVNDDAATTQGAYMLWDGVEVELEAGEHTLTYTVPPVEYRTNAEGTDNTSSWHWRTIYLMKKAA